MAEDVATPSTAVQVPFVDLSHQHRELKNEILGDLEALIDADAFIGGEQVEAFEREFAAACGSAHCVGVSSGLDGLRIALLADGIEPGDEVIAPAFTFAATVEAITQAGGRPVLVDVSEQDYGIDIDGVAAAVTTRTRFVIPVHLYGQMMDLRALLEITRRANVGVVEDAAQAHGAERDGLLAGAGGLAGAFSFYPAKNLGAMGDAGALVTNDSELATQTRALREHGQRVKYHHELEGYTARLDAFQAVVLRHKLRHLAGWTGERRALARLYDELLAGVGDLRLPQVPDGSSPVWHLYVIRTQDPEGLARFLRERGIGSGRHYPQPLHLAPAYARLAYPQGSFPVSEAVADEVLSLPIYPGMQSQQVEYVSAALADYFAG